MGGISSEREISIASGNAVVEGLTAAGHQAYPVLLNENALSWDSHLEIAFIALHGRFGEDGGIQSYFESNGIPFTGSSSKSARCSFDKVRTRERLLQEKIRIPKGELIEGIDQRTLSMPVVIKPPCEGSSVGCEIIQSERDWKRAFPITASINRSVLVEEYIAGRELTVGILGDETLPIVEVEPAGDWFDFQSKYRSDQTRYEVPARLDVEAASQIKEIALDVYRALGARGCARVDFRLDESGIPYVLELNSIPGFTPKSLLPKAAAAAGISFPQLCDRVVELAFTSA